MNPAQELVGQLREWASEFLSPDDEETPDDLLRGWRFSDREARYFLQAVDDGHMEVDASEGRRKFLGLRRGGLGTRTWERERNGIHGYRESITKSATMAELHYHYGWPFASIASEAPRGTLDILVYSSEDSDEVLVGAEVKITARALDALLEQMRVCLESGPHSRRCGLGHPKAQGLREHRPRFFLAASSEKWRVFEVGPRLSLREVGYLPHPIPR